ncbi:hypothetical protein [Nannocystis pusilla]|uniref:hypothetical protein n=1 Tax=Nannocystis pusilla TaxID=889268 RepID=UPI003B8115EB
MNDLVDSVLEQARAAWPGTAWQREDVARRLAGVDPQLWSEPAAADRRAELLIAWACLLGDRDAIRHLEVRYVRDVVPNLRALDLAGEELDEMVQTLRVALLVGAPGVSRSSRATRGAARWEASCAPSRSGWCSIASARANRRTSASWPDVRSRR